MTCFSIKSKVITKQTSIGSEARGSIFQRASIFVFFPFKKFCSVRMKILVFIVVRFPRYGYFFLILSDWNKIEMKNYRSSTNGRSKSSSQSHGKKFTKCNSNSINSRINSSKKIKCIKRIGRRRIFYSARHFKSRFWLLFIYE